MSVESYDHYLQMLKLPRSAPEADIRSAVSKELRVLTQRTNAPKLELRQEAERLIATLEAGEKVLLGQEGQFIRKQRGGSSATGSRLEPQVSVDPDTVAKAIERLALAQGKKAQERQKTVLAKRATIFRNGVEYVFEELMHKKYEGAQDSKNCRANQGGLLLFDWQCITTWNGQQGSVKTYVQGPWVTDVIATASSLDAG